MPFLPTLAPVSAQPSGQVVGRLPAFEAFGPQISFPNSAPGMRHVVSDHLNGPWSQSLTFTLPTNCFVLVYFWVTCFVTVAGQIAGMKYTMDGVQSNSWVQQWFNEASSHKTLGGIYHVWNCGVYNVKQDIYSSGAVQLSSGSHTFATGAVANGSSDGNDFGYVSIFALA